MNTQVDFRKGSLTINCNQVYYGVGWRKKYKAPTDFCFAVKHPRLQQPKSTKYIKFLCAEDNASLERWMVGIRVAKYGRQLMENYRALVDELAQEDLDLLAHARSCSVSSIAVPPNQTQYNTTNDNARQFAENVRHSNETTVATTRQYDGQRQSYNPEQRQSYNNDGRLSRASSSSSSGCLSDGAPSSCEVNMIKHYLIAITMNPLKKLLLHATYYRVTITGYNYLILVR